MHTVHTFLALCYCAGIFTGVVLYFEITSLFQDPIMSSCCVSRYELPDFANILWGKDISIFCPSTGHTATFIGACKKRWNQEVGGGGKVCGTPCKEVRWLPLTCTICTTGPRGTFVWRLGQWQRTIDPPIAVSMCAYNHHHYHHSHPQISNDMSQGSPLEIRINSQS